MKSEANTSVVRELQRDLISDGSSLASSLNKAYLIAKKLKLNDFYTWIELEQQGYQNCKNGDIPPYRRISIRPHYRNPYNGWQPIVMTTDTDRLYFETGLLTQPLTELEISAKMTGEKLYYYSANHANWLARKLSRSFDLNVTFEVAGIFPSSSLNTPIINVRKILLDWTLKLDESGIMGENLGFSTTEAAKAMTVTQHIHAQNIGVIGSISGNKDTSIVVNNHLDRAAVQSAASRISEAATALPQNTRAEVIEALAEIEKSDFEPSSASKDKFSLIKRICEGASGNLAAEGIVSLISNLIGS